jgi:hypothetical protein
MVRWRGKLTEGERQERQEGRSTKRGRYRNRSQGEEEKGEGESRRTRRKWGGAAASGNY